MNDAYFFSLWRHRLQSSVYNCTTGYQDFGTGVTAMRRPQRFPERVPAVSLWLSNVHENNTVEPLFYGHVVHNMVEIQRKVLDEQSAEFWR